jgi:hypothetical protein
VDACDEIREAYERERRIYRGRTVAMLRRYMRYSIETGRLPSLLGKEFFRAKVTSYTVATFEDRVIFVHDMEKCLERLNEFSRQPLARHVLQEQDQVATARLLHCAERRVRLLTPYALDQLSEILLKVGLLERVETNAEIVVKGEEAFKGQLAPTKYLLEVAGVYPLVTDGEQATQEEACLAKPLLESLNIPKKPALEEDEEPAGTGDVEAEREGGGGWRQE